MFNRISSLTLAILMFVVLYGSRTSLLHLGLATAGLILAALAVNFKRLNFTWPHLLLPVIYLIGVGSVFTVITDPLSRTVFLGLAAIVFYLMEVRLGRESHLLQNIFLLSVFAWYVGLFAAQYYFPLSSIFLAAAVFGATYLFVLQGFAGFNQPAKKHFYFLISLVCAEAAWGLTLWPTHFLINAVVLFVLFYIMWLFAFSAFFGKLSPAKIVWQIFLAILVLSLVLYTAPWKALK